MPIIPLVKSLTRRVRRSISGSNKPDDTSSLYQRLSDSDDSDSEHSDNDSDSIDGQWTGNLPCIDGPDRGCAAHNPEGLTVAHNANLPPFEKKRMFSRRKKGPKMNGKAAPTRLKPRITSQLHPDHSIVDPLESIHPSTPYALAWYHLNWVQCDQLGSTSMGRARSLACRGTGRGRPDLKYTFEPYFHQNRFLLHQKIRFAFPLRQRSFKTGIFDHERRTSTAALSDNQKAWTFCACLHMRTEFKSFEVKMKRSIAKAEARYEVHLGGTEPASEAEWKSIYGVEEKYWTCTVCHTDQLVRMELKEGVISTQFEVFKDLGQGKDRGDVKWLAALRRPEKKIWTPPKRLLSRNLWERIYEAKEAVCSLDYSVQP
ncbi:hypothetical protein F4780DRAFT_86963 [Xylariomycetidae sp. FL0641]|nr:hypothetical protein F4780DRAFT_86963 [Xylariomycetidae sp. FL0641]